MNDEEIKDVDKCPFDKKENTNKYKCAIKNISLL